MPLFVVRQADRLAAALRARKLLIVWDNFEVVAGLGAMGRGGRRGMAFRGGRAAIGCPGTTGRRPRATCRVHALRRGLETWPRWSGNRFSGAVDLLTRVSRLRAEEGRARDRGAGESGTQRRTPHGQATGDLPGGSFHPTQILCLQAGQGFLGERQLSRGLVLHRRSPGPDGRSRRVEPPGGHEPATSLVPWAASSEKRRHPGRPAPKAASRLDRLLAPRSRREVEDQPGGSWVMQTQFFCLVSTVELGMQALTAKQIRCEPQEERSAWPRQMVSPHPQTAVDEITVVESAIGLRVTGPSSMDARGDEQELGAARLLKASTSAARQLSASPAPASRHHTTGTSHFLRVIANPPVYIL
jgi:hypothetical protein